MAKASPMFPFCPSMKAQTLLWLSQESPVLTVHTWQLWTQTTGWMLRCPHQGCAHLTFPRGTGTQL